MKSYKEYKEVVSQYFNLPGTSTVNSIWKSVTKNLSKVNGTFAERLLQTVFMANREKYIEAVVLSKLSNRPPYVLMTYKDEKAFKELMLKYFSEQEVNLQIRIIKLYNSDYVLHRTRRQLWDIISMSSSLVESIRKCYTPSQMEQYRIRKGKHHPFMKRKTQKAKILDLPITDEKRFIIKPQQLNGKEQRRINGAAKKFTLAEKTVSEVKETVKARLLRIAEREVNLEVERLFKSADEAKHKVKQAVEAA